MEFKEPKIIKTFFILEKGIRFFTKRSNKKSNFVFQQKINAYVLNKAKTHGPPPQPISPCSSHLSRERKKKNTTIEPVTNKTTNHGIAVNKETIQLPAAKKTRTRKAKTPADSSDHDSQRNRTSRPTPLVTPPAAEGPRKQK
jgi:hypothetical protein